MDQPEPVLSSHEITPEQRIRTRQFVADLLKADQAEVPITFPEADETVTQVQTALEHLATHSATTLYPADGTSEGLASYSTAEQAAAQHAQALRDIYIRGMPVSSLVAADGQPLSRTGQNILKESALRKLRFLLAGNPGPGWMDGTPIDVLRTICMPYAYAERRRNYERLLEIRDNMHTYNYSRDDIPLAMLPLSDISKRRLRNAGYKRVGDLPQDLSHIHGIDKRQEVAFVISRLTESDTQFSQVWLGQS